MLEHVFILVVFALISNVSFPSRASDIRSFLVDMATWSDFFRIWADPPSWLVSSPMSSPLTEAFTPPEQEALSKFKTDYLQRALKEIADESTSYTPEIWNIPITPEDPRVDVIIVKFLRAKYPPCSSCSALIKVNLFFQRRTHNSSRH
jgi:hypothetical protein